MTCCLDINPAALPQQAALYFRRNAALRRIASISGTDYHIEATYTRRRRTHPILGMGTWITLNVDPSERLRKVRAHVL